MSLDAVLLLGAGFLGRALTARVVASGRPVYLLARRSAGGMPSGVSVHTGGLDNEAALRALLPHCGTVIHLASTTTPSLSADHPLLEVDQNIAPTVRFLKVLEEFPAIHLLYLSTGGALYGDTELQPATEAAAVAPRSYHGAGKAAIEALLGAQASRSGSALTVLRPANFYGPYQPLRAGFGVIRTMLEHARNGTEFEIWGDGEAVRDFLYIDDMVEVCHRFIQLPDDRGTYNVGSGAGYSINQVRALVERVCGQPLRVRYRPRRAVDVQRIVLDITRVSRRLEWTPRVDLEEGIRRTWVWLGTMSPPASRPA